MCCINVGSAIVSFFRSANRNAGSLDELWFWRWESNVVRLLLTFPSWMFFLLSLASVVVSSFALALLWLLLWELACAWEGALLL